MHVRTNSRVMVRRGIHRANGGPGSQQIGVDQFWVVFESLGGKADVQPPAWLPGAVIVGVIILIPGKSMHEHQGDEDCKVERGVRFA